MFSGVFSTLNVNKDKILDHINESYILALDMAELLVQDIKIPFRQAHKIVANLVKESKNPKDLLNKEKIEKKISEIMNKKINLADTFINSFKNLESCLEKRKSEGSPSKLEVK